MSYNINELPKFMNTAGKITIITSLIGVMIFAVVFLLDLGTKELKEAKAQAGLATTTITVLNTPPAWTILAHERFESSATNPTNSGSTTVWAATAYDNNDEDYYLLICSGSSTPTARTGLTPLCGGTDFQWAVSALSSSTQQAIAATTTIDKLTASSSFDGEQHEWYAWICDTVSNARCNASYATGTAATNSSPFNVNSRPRFSLYNDTGGTDPGGTVTFYATSSDPDHVPGDDTVQLHVCSTDSFNTTSTFACEGTTLATSTFVTSNPSATYNLPSVMPDTDYDAYGFIIDEHNHPSNDTAQQTNTFLTVNNVAPTVPASQIDLNNATSLILTQNAGETTGFELQFTANDANSCYQSDLSTFEVQDYIVSIYHSGIASPATSTCNGTSTSQYDANNCYTSAVATSTWNLNCTASTTSCDYDGVNNFDSGVVYDCTFPLWYVADPTDGTSTVSVHHAEQWYAAVSAIDNDGATSSSHTQAQNGRELLSFLYLALDTLSIPYDDLEPGSWMSLTTATTTVRSEGNTGLDEYLSGESMCGTYTTGNTCPTSATSTIPESEQVFATSSIQYGTASSSGNTLSSTTLKLLDLNVKKATETGTTTEGVTYWGIRVPNTITLAGLYTGENTFWAALSDPSQW